jgi:phage terminase large subunit GpA-like protein
MTAQFSPNIDSMMKRVMAAFRPPEDLTVSAWADRYRYLSAESSASPGRFRTEIVEYMREPMDMVGAPGVRSISLMTSAQVAKSTVLENVIAYFMHQDPCPILHVSPTLESMKMFSKERLAPMIRDCPVLTGIVKDPRSRDSGNTLASKVFPGGHIAMVGSNAPAGLASRPVRVLVADEVDRFEQSAGTEGDPINLAIKRTTTFWNRVLIFVSTPGDKGRSRIEKLFEEGDQRYRWCPCGDCGEHQRLKWAQVRWTNNDPSTAFYECEHCGSVWDDVKRNIAVRRGEWRAEKPFNGNLSYHLSQLYSPFAPLSDGVRDFISAKDNPQFLKTWVNTFLGETWEERGQRLEWSHLLDRREEYELRDGIPEEVTAITVGADIQDDRAEVEWVGWGDDHRSWSLGYRRIYGDLSTPTFWSDVKAALAETFIHPLFGEIIPRRVAMDAGGHYTTEVYAFSAANERVSAIRGVAGAAKPAVGRPMKNTIGGHLVIPLGVDTIKETVVARLRQNDPNGAGYCTFHTSQDEAYFRGLTSEELRTTFRKGFPSREWHKVSASARNEPFDCRVYATGALEIAQIDLNAYRRALLLEMRKRGNGDVGQTKSRVVKRGTDYVNGWTKDE